MVADCFECGNEPSVSIEFEEFLDWLLKKGLVQQCRQRNDGNEATNQRNFEFICKN